MDGIVRKIDKGNFTPEHELSIASCHGPETDAG